MLTLVIGMSNCCQSHSRSLAQMMVTDCNIYVILVTNKISIILKLQSSVDGMSGLCPKKRIIQFIPDKWQQQLGQNCYTCRGRLVSDQCISLCKCQMFVHEQCFLKQFAPYIGKEKIQCIRCDHEVQLVKNYHYKWNCENIKRPTTIVSIVLAVLMIIAFIIMTALGLYRNVVADGVVYGIIVVAIVLLTIVIVLSMRQKQLTLDDVSAVDTNMANKPLYGTTKTKSIDNSDYDSHKQVYDIL